MSEHIDFARRAVMGALAMGATLAVGPTAKANSLTPAALTGPANAAGRFAGKAVLITGATSGIGRTTALAFAREGARVLFNGRRAGLGAAVETEIRAIGGDAAYVQGDVRGAAQVEAFIAEGVRRFGRIDVLYNNAGIFMTPGEIQDIAFDNYRDIMATNAGGVFLGMKYAIPVMRAQGGGVIVNMASVAGHKGYPNTAAYNASKHAIIGMTKAVAVANARHNIRVTSISPLAVDTPQLAESLAYQNIDPAEIAPNFVTPRIMTTDEIARAVMFLASDEATSVTGMDLDVTGGQLA